MVGLLVSKSITIQSHKGEYIVEFSQDGLARLGENPSHNAIYIIDENIVALYGDKLADILNSQRFIVINATEKNKSLSCFPDYINRLVGLNIRRDQVLIAIGGGITQDITCFLAATLMRGLPWMFYPTTLLAQADSCIGSKSSINSGDIKNILGTFTPPNEVVIDVGVLKSLEEKDILSGIGEMIKVHAIDSPDSFDEIADQYKNIFEDYTVMESFIHQSLLMKKKLIEADEFDKGVRNVMNYGHSFGHAIESATKYGIPHGVAVTIGMDIANYVAVELKISTIAHFDRMHSLLAKNCKIYRGVKIDINLLLSALSKDKKNSDNQLRLILPDKNGVIGVGLYDNNDELFSIISDYLAEFHGGVAND
jgi:3-dehydroquinate synthase